MDHIAPYEMLQKQFNWICSNLGLPVEKLEHRNKAWSLKKYPHYSTYYSSQLRKMVGQMYEEDIDIFKYTFEKLR